MKINQLLRYGAIVNLVWAILCTTTRSILRSGPTIYVGIFFLIMAVTILYFKNFTYRYLNSHTALWTMTYIYTLIVNAFVFITNFMSVEKPNLWLTIIVLSGDFAILILTLIIGLQLKKSTYKI